MKNDYSSFILIACFLGLFISCSGSKFNGAYTGALTTGPSISGSMDEEKNLPVLVKQDGDEVFLTISGSRLLGECSLRGKINKNGIAYIDNPQTCSNSTPLQGSISVGGDELLFSLRGNGQFSNEYFQFRGMKK